MLENKVVHKLEEGVVSVVDEKVSYYNEAAFRLFPQLEKGGDAGFLKVELPDSAGTITCGTLSFRYQKITSGAKLHYVFSPPEKKVPIIGLSGKEMVRFCQLVGKESDDIFAQLLSLDEKTLQHSRIQIHASRLQRMADMLHHTINAQYIEPHGMVDLIALLEELKEECTPIFSALNMTLNLEKPEKPVKLYTQKRELQRLFFLLFSVFGKKGQSLQLTLDQRIHKVEVTLQATKGVEIMGLERYCLEELLQGLEGKIPSFEEKFEKKNKKDKKMKEIVLQLKVEQIHAQLQSGNQGEKLPLLPVNGVEKAIYLASAEIFMANCLPEDFFCSKQEEEEEKKEDNKKE